ncbi:MAG: ATP-binding protein [Oscillibacter sp.]|nr:ATP-binding protein [Oscillibacter sp.]
MAKLILEATIENEPKVEAFIASALEGSVCSPRAVKQLNMAVEELFVNIARYAYNPDVGLTEVQVEIQQEPLQASITFIDNGVPYDPLAKPDPNTSLSGRERELGGLGIFMVKKSMDLVSYKYEDGKNILTIQKKM